MSLDNNTIKKMQYAVVYYNKKDYNKALQIFEYVEGISRGLPDAHYWLSKIHLAMDEKKIAKSYFKNALNFLHITSYKNQAQIDIFNTWVKEYDEMFNTSYLLKFSTYNNQVEKKVAQQINSNKKKEALVTINGTKNLTQKLLNDKYNILRAAKSTELLEIFGYILHDNEDNKELVIDVVNLLIDFQYYYIASVLLQTLIHIDGDYHVPYFKLARMAFDMNEDIDIAIKYSEKSIEKKDNTDSRMLLIACYEKLGQLDKVQEQIEIIKENFSEVSICETVMSLFTIMDIGDCKDILDGLKVENGTTLLNLLGLQLQYGRLNQTKTTIEKLDKKFTKPKELKLKDKKLQKRLENIEDVVSFFSIGRGGSYFFHSLIDGHKQIATIPGAFLKGYFDFGVFKMFLSGTHEDFIAKFMNIYEAMFDAASIKSIPGDPMGGKGKITLAATCGLTTLGEDRDIKLQIDKQRFAKILLSYMKGCRNIDEKTLFKILHLAFEEIRGDDVDKKRVIFYHIHNPNIVEYYRFYKLFDTSKPLFIVRNYLQGLESWMYSDYQKIDTKNMDYEQRINLFRQMYRAMYGKINGRIFSNRNIMLVSKEVYVIRLEDVKTKSEETMKAVAEFMDIEYEDSMLKAEFMGLKFHSNKSKLNPTISGFDTKSIKRKVGVLFSHDDAVLLNTVLRPWNEAYEYDEGEFKYISIDEALKLNENIMGWEQDLIDMFDVTNDDAMKLIKLRISKVKLALETQDQIKEELKKVTLIKPMEVI